MRTRHNIFYTNSEGAVISLNDAKTIYTEPSFFSSAWKHEIIDYGGGMAEITKTYAEPVTHKVTAQVRANTKLEFYERLEELRAILELDAINQKLGVLTVNEWNLDCVISIHNTGKLEVVNIAKVELEIFAPRSEWYKKQIDEWNGYDVTTNPIEGSKKYAYKYKYKCSSSGALTRTITTDIKADAIIEFFGPCVNPSMQIGPNSYSVNASALAGEKMIINTQTWEVYKVINTGETLNLFHLRGANSFEQIPKGVHIITRSAGYPIKLTLIERRAEPPFLIR